MRISVGFDLITKWLRYNRSRSRLEAPRFRRAMYMPLDHGSQVEEYLSKGQDLVGPKEQGKAFKKASGSPPSRGGQVSRILNCEMQERVLNIVKY